MVPSVDLMVGCCELADITRNVTQYMEFGREFAESILRAMFREDFSTMKSSLAVWLKSCAQEVNSYCPNFCHGSWVRFSAPIPAGAEAEFT